jgi:hypothetical protein
MRDLARIIDSQSVQATEGRGVYGYVARRTDLGSPKR